MSTSPLTFHRDRFTWLAYLSLAFYGYLLNVLGPLTPFLKDELHLSYTVASLHFSAFAAGMLGLGLGGHWLVERLGRARALWVGAFGLSLGAGLLLAGRTPVLTIGASFIMGLVGSLILVIVSGALSDQHGELRAVALSEANVIASLVSAAAPLLVGWSARTPWGWRLAVGLAALAPLGLYVALGRTAAPTAGRSSAANATAGQRLPGLFWVYWAALMLSVSVEFCMISWSADFLEHRLGLLRADAAQALVLFFAGMILGRLAASRLVQRLAAAQVVAGAIMLAGLGFLIFWLGGAAWLSLGGLFITGLGVAGLYPLTLALALGAAPGHTDQASARATLASGTAILALPLLLGRLADAVGIQSAYGVVTVLLVGVLLITQWANRRARA